MQSNRLSGTLFGIVARRQSPFAARFALGLPRALCARVGSAADGRRRRFAPGHHAGAEAAFRSAGSRGGLACPSLEISLIFSTTIFMACNGSEWAAMRA